MKSFLLELFIFFASLTAVWCSDAIEIEPRATCSTATSLQTVQHCATQYCANQLHNVPTSLKTIRTSVKKTVTKKIAVKTHTVKDPKIVLTKTTIVPCTSTITISTIIKDVIKYTSTKRATVWTTTTGKTTITKAQTTVTRTPATKTIPAPSAFTAIYDDPQNFNLPRPRSFTRRDADPEPVPAVHKYPKAVVCTKTIKTLITITTYKTVAKTTVKMAGRTAWKRVYNTKSTKYVTYTLPYAPTSIRTKRAVKTVTTTSTHTVQTTITISSSTATVVLPTPSYYAACGSRNQAPPPELPIGAPNSYAIRAREPLGNSIYFETNGTMYDCCVACHTLPASRGICLGTGWRNYTFVPNPCHWPDCQPPNLPETARCRLFLADRGNTCRRHEFGFGDPFLLEEFVGVTNGPGCAFWKNTFRIPAS